LNRVEVARAQAAAYPRQSVWPQFASADRDSEHQTNRK
jgi:hypothetical protein